MLPLWLDSNKKLKIVQIYGLNTATDDDEAEKFYKELESTLVVNSTHTVVLGDFNAKYEGGEKDRKRYR